MYRDVRLELRNRRRPPSRADQLDRVVLDRRCVQLSQPGDVGFGPRLGRELLERRARPQRQRPFERPDPVAIRLRLRQQGGEHGGVDGSAKTIPALRRLDDGVAETPAKSRHNRPQRARRDREHLTEQVHPQRPRGVHGQPGQQPALARAGQIERQPRGGDDLNRSQHAHERDVNRQLRSPHPPLTLPARMRPDPCSKREAGVRDPGGMLS